MIEDVGLLCIFHRPFVLLTGTVIALFLFVGGSIALLYSIGNDELPGTLTGGAPVSKRD